MIANGVQMAAVIPLLRPLHLLLLCALLGVSSAQLGSSFFGYQSTSGVRESLLAINAYCDTACSPPMGLGQLSQCWNSAIAENEPIIQIMRFCSQNSNYIIYCTQNRLVQLELCVLQYASRYFSVTNSYTRSCFRESLSVGTIDCLRLRHPRLNRLLPLGPHNSGSMSSLNAAR